MGDRVAVMSKGVLQQVDAPQRLYDQPANLFVAGFIGTPPMNLLEATVAVRTAARRRSVGGQPLPLADEALAQLPGRPRCAGAATSCVGVRADDLHVAAQPARTCRRSTRAAGAASRRSARESMAYFQRRRRRSSGRGIDDGRGGAERTAEGVTATRPNLVASFPPREAH